MGGKHVRRRSWPKVTRKRKRFVQKVRTRRQRSLALPTLLSNLLGWTRLAPCLAKGRRFSSVQMSRSLAECSPTQLCSTHACKNAACHQKDAGGGKGTRRNPKEKEERREERREKEHNILDYPYT